MHPAELQNLRVCLLQQLRQAGAYALPADALMVAAKQTGFPELLAAELRAELSYLADKALVTEEKKTISPEVKRWRITAAGRDLLAEEGL